MQPIRFVSEECESLNRGAQIPGSTLLSGVGGLELLVMCMTDLPRVPHPLKRIVQLLLGFPYLLIYSFTYLLTYLLMFKLARVEFCDLGSE